MNFTTLTKSSGSLFGVETRSVLTAATGTVLGFTHLWPVGTVLLIGLLYYRGWKFELHPVAIAIGALIALTGVWSNDPMAGVLWALNLQVLVAVYMSPVDKRLWFRTVSFLTVPFIIMAMIEIQFMGDTRPETLLVKDASVLGLMGLSTFSPLLGLSGSRAGLLGMYVFTFFTWRKSVVIALIASTIVLVTIPISYGDAQRLSPSQIVSGIETRDVLAPTIEWTPIGLGYHSYTLETGRQRPHNILVLAWWELGLFTIPLVSLLIIGAIMANVSLRAIAVLVTVGMFTDEIFARIEGQFIVLSMILMAHYLPPQIMPVRSIYDRIQGTAGNISGSTRS